MKNKLLKSIFSSGLQAIAVQIIGAAFFFVLSFELSVADFGLVSKLNGLAMMLTTLLSFGLEQVVVRRIAASKSSEWAAAAYLAHAFFGSLFGFAILYTISVVFGGTSVDMRLLPWFFVAQSIVYMGAPLKQFLNARQQFGPYGVIALVSNMIKILLAFGLIYTGKLVTDTVYVVLIICALIELGALLAYVKLKTDFKFSFRRKAYTKLLKEALPQYAMAIFDSSLSRLDVILIGYIATNAMTGEYVWAYRAFELARLPIVIIAPIILAKFARMLATGNKIAEDKRAEVADLFSVEMFFATLIPLVLNILWVPLVSYCMKGKYGASNADEFMILSVCIPFQFAINMLWTIAFASKKYKAVTTITVITAVANMVLNLVLIPLYGGVGAAIAFLISSIVQAGLYYSLVRRNVMHLPVKPFIICMLIGTVSYIVAVKTNLHVVLQVMIALTLYTVLATMLKQVGKRHLLTVKSYLSK